MHRPSQSAAARLPERLLALLFTLLASLLAFSIAQETTGVNNAAVVRVIGQGIVYGQPDIATLELGVTATDPDAGTAVRQIDEGMRQVLAALSDLGVPDEEIRTISYNIWREERFPRDDSGSSEAIFRAQHMIAVELEGAGRAGEVLTAAVDAGANAVGGITFGFSNPDELKARARAAAVEDARTRAEQLAAAAGVSVGEALIIEEIIGAVPPGPYLERSAMATDAAPISPGQLSVEVRVAVSYRIE